LIAGPHARAAWEGPALRIRAAMSSDRKSISFALITASAISSAVTRLLIA